MTENSWLIFRVQSGRPVLQELTTLGGGGGGGASDWSLTNALPELPAWQRVAYWSAMNEQGRRVLVGGETALNNGWAGSLCYSPLRRKFYLLNTTTPAIMELSESFVKLRTITLSGFTNVRHLKRFWSTSSPTTEQFILSEFDTMTGGTPARRGCFSIIEIPESGSVTVTKGGTNTVRTITPQWAALESGNGLQAVCHVHEGLAGTTEPFLCITGSRDTSDNWQLWAVANLEGNISPSIINNNLGTLLGAEPSDVVDMTWSHLTHSAVLLSSATESEPTHAMVTNLMQSGGQWGVASQYELDLDDARGIELAADDSHLFITELHGGSSTAASLHIYRTP